MRITLLLPLPLLFPMPGEAVREPAGAAGAAVRSAGNGLAEAIETRSTQGAANPRD